MLMRIPRDPIRRSNLRSAGRIVQKDLPDFHQGVVLVQLGDRSGINFLFCQEIFGSFLGSLDLLVPDTDIIARFGKNDRRISAGKIFPFDIPDRFIQEIISAFDIRGVTRELKIIPAILIETVIPVNTSEHCQNKRGDRNCQHSKSTIRHGFRSFFSNDALVVIKFPNN